MAPVREGFIEWFEMMMPLTGLIIEGSVRNFKLAGLLDSFYFILFYFFGVKSSLFQNFRA